MHGSLGAGPRRLRRATLAGLPLARKTSWSGHEARRAWLGQLGLQLPNSFPGADRRAPDDVLDAAICAWVADGTIVGDSTVERLPPDASPPDASVGAIHRRRLGRSHHGRRRALA